jgi:hypothetical protein
MGSPSKDGQSRPGQDQTLPTSQCRKGADWFHISGITPALSQSAADLSLQAVREAKARDVTVSCDYNYRGKLWNYGKKASEVMRELVRHVDAGIANEEDCQLSLGISVGDDSSARYPAPGELDITRYEKLCQKVFAAWHQGIGAGPSAGTTSAAVWRRRMILRISEATMIDSATQMEMIHPLRRLIAQRPGLRVKARQSLLDHSRREWPEPRDMAGPHLPGTRRAIHPGLGDRRRHPPICPKRSPTTTQASSADALITTSARISMVRSWPGDGLGAIPEPGMTKAQPGDAVLGHGRRKEPIRLTELPASGRGRIMRAFPPRCHTGVHVPEDGDR